MLPTPSTSHVDTDKIYEPAEDSFLLLDVLSSDGETEFLTRRFAREASVRTSCSPLVLEVGTGSGVVLAFVAANALTVFGTQHIIPIGTDLNHFACAASEETVRRACKDHAVTAQDAIGPRLQGGLCTVLNADLTSPLRAGVVDVLIFNPPYVPSMEVPSILHEIQDAEIPGGLGTDSYLLSLSYEGGKDGMEVTNRLLDRLPGVLSERGVAYILLCRQNEPEEVIAQIRSWGAAWSVRTVGRSGKKAGWEKLQVIRIDRQPT